MKFNCWVPVGALPLIFTVNCALSPVSGPGGLIFIPRPLVSGGVTVMASEKPPVLLTLRVTETTSPLDTVSDPGEADSEKSKLGGLMLDANS